MEGEKAIGQVTVGSPALVTHSKSLGNRRLSHAAPA
jgi:hypothetical protein